MSAQFEHPDFPREIADAPDIDNVPAASSMHALMECVTEIYGGVRQIQEALSPEAYIERMRDLAPAAIELMNEAEANWNEAFHPDGDGAEPADATPAPLDPKWKPGRSGKATVLFRGTLGLVPAGSRRVFLTAGVVAPGDTTSRWVDELDDLLSDEQVFDFVPDATATCAHGQTAEDLCNAMPDKIELDAMWTAWKSLTPAEQRGWLEGGEGKVPTPTKVSGRPVVTRAQVFDILYPDGILPAEDMRESKIDALIALFGGAS